jgi:hypothetical protein
MRFNEVRTATEPHRTAVRCGSYIVEPQNREVRFEVLDIGTGTAPFRGLHMAADTIGNWLPSSGSVEYRGGQSLWRD